MKKFLAILLALTCVLSTVPALAVSAENAETDSTTSEATIPDPAADSIAISDVNDLKGMEKDKKYHLTKDITITGDWEGASLEGITLDGQNKTITFDGAVLKNGGVFGKLTNATVKNLKFETKDNAVVKSNNGVLAEQFYSGTVENVHFGEMVLEPNKDGDAWRQVGTICGSLNDNVKLTEKDLTLTITNCTNRCTFTEHGQHNNHVGGFIGATWGGKTYSTHVTFENCMNFASVTGWSNVGGFVGNASGGSLTIKNCLNDGAMVAKNGDSGYAGGFVGNCAVEATLTNCDNTGNVAGIKVAGGILGNCTATATFKNCLNEGDVLVNNGDTKGAGIVGVLDGSGTITIGSCVNYGRVDQATPGAANDSDSSLGGIAGKNWSAATTLVFSYNVNYGDVGTNSKAQTSAGIVGGIGRVKTNVTMTGNVNYGKLGSGNKYTADLVPNVWNATDGTGQIRLANNYGLYELKGSSLAVTNYPYDSLNKTTYETLSAAYANTYALVGLQIVPKWVAEHDNADAVTEKIHGNSAWGAFGDMGWHRTDVVDGEWKWRLVVGVQDWVMDADKAGIEITMVFKENGTEVTKTYEASTKSVCTSVKADDQEVKATDRGYAYLYTLEIYDIPDNVEFVKVTNVVYTYTVNDVVYKTAA